MTDSRYPYTYACDYIRMLGPVAGDGVVLSRADASQIRSGIAKALGIDDKELAKKLANAQIKNDNDAKLQQLHANRVLAALGLSTSENDYDHG